MALNVASSNTASLQQDYPSTLPKTDVIQPAHSSQVTDAFEGVHPRDQYLLGQNVVIPKFQKGLLQIGSGPMHIDHGRIAQAVQIDKVFAHINTCLPALLPALSQMLTLEGTATGAVPLHSAVLILVEAVHLDKPAIAQADHRRAVFAKGHCPVSLDIIDISRAARTAVLASVPVAVDFPTTGMM